MKDYIARLMQRGELRIVDKEVDPTFELAAVVERSQAESSLPILFRNVKGTRLPVVSNLFGSHQRICELLGTSAGNLCRRWVQILESLPTVRPDYVRMVTGESRIHGKISDLPAITWREKDAGPYITAGVFLARDPDSAIHNLSFSRSFMKSESELLCDIAPVHDLGRYQARAEAKGRPLEVCVLIAPPPEIFLAGCASVPIDVDELQVAAAIRGGPLEMQRCATLDLSYPVGTQVVIEGRIRPGERADEGPFGEFMGYYGGLNKNGFIFDVAAVHWEADPVFHGLLCGTAEDMTALDIAFATRTYAALANSMPGILDVTCNPMFFCTVVQIDKQYEAQAQQVMLKVFAANLNYNFVCIVVDKDVNPRDLRQVFHAYLTRGRVDRRITVLPDVAAWDHSADSTYAGRVGIDATMPLGRETEFEVARTPGSAELNLRDYFRQ